MTDDLDGIKYSRTISAVFYGVESSSLLQYPIMSICFQLIDSIISRINSKLILCSRLLDADAHLLQLNILCGSAKQVEGSIVPFVTNHNNNGNLSQLFSVCTECSHNSIRFAGETRAYRGWTRREREWERVAVIPRCAVRMLNEESIIFHSLL